MMRYWVLIFLLGLVHLSVLARDAEQPSELAALLNAVDETGFAKATTVRPFTFPHDHGPHARFRNEWWYFTGNLDSPNDRRFGFELTFFRFSLSPKSESSSSAWRTNQVYIAHLAVTDVASQQFLTAEKVARGAAGLAGAQRRPFRVWMDTWQITADADHDHWQLVADDERIGINLALTPLKPPVLNGEAGLSRKSSSTDSASYYYTMPRLQTSGTLTIDSVEYAVNGLSWLDREWSTSALADDQLGWDWFSLQLSDGSDLMLYNLRKTDDTVDSASSGTLTDPSGQATSLSLANFDVTVLDTWNSPAGGTYPAKWRLRLPAYQLDLTVTPVLADQELFTTVRYWEGAVDVSGRKDGQTIDGRGYVELTGYAEATDE